MKLSSAPLCWGPHGSRHMASHQWPSHHCSKYQALLSRHLYLCLQLDFSICLLYREKLMEYRTPMQYYLGAYRQLFRGQWGGRNCLHLRLVVVSRNSGLPFAFPPSIVRGLFSQETWATWGFTRVSFSRRVSDFDFLFQPCRTLSSEVPYTFAFVTF